MVTKKGFLALGVLTALQISMGVGAKLLLTKKQGIATTAVVTSICELIKLIYTIGLMIWTSETHSLGESIEKIKASTSMPVVKGALILSAIYAINNNVVLTLYGAVDPAVVVLVRTASSIFTALLLWTFGLKQINSVHWLATIVQVLGLIVNQYNACSGGLAAPVSAYLLTAVSAFMSSGAAVYNQSYVKGLAVDVNILNFWLYVIGTILNVAAIPVLLSSFQDPAASSSAIIDPMRDIPLAAIQALVGIGTVFVYFYADALTKTYANAASTITMMAISVAFFNLEANIISWAGALLVAVSLILFFGIAEKFQEASNDSSQSSSAPGWSSQKKVAVIVGCFIALLLATSFFYSPMPVSQRSSSMRLVPIPVGNHSEIKTR